MADKKEIRLGIIGAGWLGFALARATVGEYGVVRASSRRETRLAELRALGAEAVLLDAPRAVPGAFFTGLTHAVVTLPPRGRSLGEAAETVYLAALRSLFPFLDASPAVQLLFCSSTGAYGAARGGVTEERDLKPNTHSGRAVAAAETLLRRYTDRLTILRLAGLVGPGRHRGAFSAERIFHFANPTRPSTSYIRPTRCRRYAWPPKAGFPAAFTMFAQRPTPPKVNFTARPPVHCNWAPAPWNRAARAPSKSAAPASELTAGNRSTTI